MHTLAVVSLVMYGLGTVVFADWKRKVNYPKKPFAVALICGAMELVFVALAIWVVV